MCVCSGVCVCVFVVVSRLRLQSAMCLPARLATDLFLIPYSH